MDDPVDVALTYLATIQAGGRRHITIDEATDILLDIKNTLAAQTELERLEEDESRNVHLAMNPNPPQTWWRR